MPHSKKRRWGWDRRRKALLAFRILFDDRFPDERHLVEDDERIRHAGAIIKAGYAKGWRGHQEFHFIREARMVWIDDLAALGIQAACGEILPFARIYEDADGSDRCFYCVEGLYNFQPVVYRAFDDRGSLLYVGYSHQMRERRRQHSVESSWHSDVSRWTYERFVTQAGALYAERVAIATEKPKCNNPRGSNRIHALFAA